MQFIKGKEFRTRNGSRVEYAGGNFFTVISGGHTRSLDWAGDRPGSRYSVRADGVYAGQHVPEEVLGMSIVLRTRNKDR